MPAVLALMYIAILDATILWVAGSTPVFGASRRSSSVGRAKVKLEKFMNQSSYFKVQRSKIFQIQPSSNSKCKDLSNPTQKFLMGYGITAL